VLIRIYSTRNLMSFIKTLYKCSPLVAIFAVVYVTSFTVIGGVGVITIAEEFFFG